MADNFFGLTDAGKQRSNNEDTFIAQTVYADRVAACVIDGVGGYEGGEVAAKIAREVILQQLELSTAGNNMQQVLYQALEKANEAIYVEKQTGKGLEQMACVLTLVLANIEQNKFYYAHVGDTRLYLLRDESLVKVTHDHSFVGFLEDSGRLTEEEAMRHPKRNEINKALGFDAQIHVPDYIETGESPFLPGDMLLLCSDGLTDMVNNKAITSILTSNKSLQSKAKALIHAANDAGGKDNVTVVLVTNSKPAVKHEVTKPVLSVKQPAQTPATQMIEAKHNDTDTKRKRSAVPLLLFISILLLMAVVWLLYRDYDKQKERNESLQNVVAVKTKKAAEQAFADSIKAGQSEVFVLNYPDTPPTLLTDSIVIAQDTLHIIGNGVTLYADTSFTGPAFIMASSCKYLLLDSMTFRNFNLAVLARNKGIRLRNVRFVNCSIPVQLQLPLQNDTSITGSLTDFVTMPD